MKSRGDENGVPTIAQSIPLALFGFGLFIGIPLTAMAVYQGLRIAISGEADGEALAGSERVSVLVGTVLHGAYLALAAVVAKLFFTRRSAAPRLIKVMLIFGIALNILEAAWALATAGDDPEHLASAFGPLVLIVPPAIWLLYFSLSRQVRQTFVYPLDSGAAGALASA